MFSLVRLERVLSAGVRRTFTVSFDPEDWERVRVVANYTRAKLQQQKYASMKHIIREAFRLAELAIRLKL